MVVILIGIQGCGGPRQAGVSGLLVKQPGACRHVLQVCSEGGVRGIRGQAEIRNHGLVPPL